MEQEPSGRILVAEDDRVTALLITRALTRLGGFEVHHTPDPRVALAWVRSQHWDLVLTDIEMPAMSGLELLAALREHAPELPVAVMTAYASVDYVVDALRCNADEFLQKPFTPEKLVATATELVARGRLARAGESRRAAGVLGATLYLEDLDDTRISEGDPTIRVIEQVVAEVAPTTVYTHSLNDVHQDHRNTHRAVMVAARAVGSVYCFQSPSATVDFRPTRFVAIDGQLDRKLTAIGAFASQVEIRSYLDTELIRSTARYWARYGDGRYAEAFEVIREAAALPVQEQAGVTAAGP
jgi:two-component system response regulator HydG